MAGSEVARRDVVEFWGGPARPLSGHPQVTYTPPTNTLDPRYRACTSHHVACDCREAEWAEERTENRLSSQGVQSAFDMVLAGHVVWLTGIALGAIVYRKGSRRLVDVCAHYGITLSEQDAHGAAADALAAGRLGWSIAAKYPGSRMDAVALHDWLVQCKREQAESFGRYLAKQGKPDDVSREWPVESPPPGWAPDQLPVAPERVAS